ncbi:DsbA family protein [Vibrio barjaei]|uniref:DsbA family protein n=1 Tax=Vibrio barjaei TaxID=1676683 RepID=UPI002283A062|nr:DsbA family protein [Vibrio barjaei]MCY9874894.1 DsbA family protein [Vibrio barjaei]
MKFITKSIITLLVTLAFSPVTYSMTKQEKIAEITQMLEMNEGVIDSVHDSLAAYIDQQSSFNKTLAESHDFIYNNPHHPWYGSEHPKLTIVNMTDFSCPWCKKLDPVLRKIADELPNDIKVINIYIPLKERDSPLNSATFGLNIWNNDREKYKAVEEMLISKPGIHNTRSIMKVAKKNKVTDYVSSNNEIAIEVAENYNLFKKLGVRGTPAMLIDGALLPGYLPYEKLYPIVKAKLDEKSK